ncbi:MAG: AAA-associated domain-containing protein [Candidatus Nitrosopolaris sp.]
MSDVPKVTFTRLLGFIDILNHIGGKADVAAISSKEQLGLNDILPILETGQMLSLIEVKSGDVSITEKGYSLLAASTPLQQKIILKQTLTNLRPFQKLVDLIKQNKTGYITKQELLEYYSSSSSSSGSDGDDDSYYDLANNFDRIIGWGRMALLIDYNSDNETIRLRNDEILDR